LYWAMRVSTTLAYQMMFVAVGWQVYDLTSSAFDLGLVGAPPVRALGGGHAGGRPRSGPLRPPPGHPR